MQPHLTDEETGLERLGPFVQSPSDYVSGRIDHVSKRKKKNLGFLLTPQLAWGLTYHCFQFLMYFSRDI